MDWVTAVVGAVSAMVGSLLTWLAARRQAEVSQYDVYTKEREIYLRSLEALVNTLRDQIVEYQKRIGDLEARLTSMTSSYYKLLEEKEAGDRRISFLEVQLQQLKKK